jgi:NADPH:quinone reductase-like Zn-dependent oxidoreductase
MRAIVQDSYGSPDTLKLAEVAKPVPADNEVLVKVHAASLNAYDWHVLRGDPYLARLAGQGPFGRRRPRNRIPGRDIAGRVESVGKSVTELRPGDEVYSDIGDDRGAFAEYVCVPAGLVALKPTNLTFEQAAAVPLAADTALVGLREVAKIEAGQRILINGASGGVGTFAVQMAAAFGAHVTAVCSTRNVRMVTELGADHVVDYTQEDFTRGTDRYDVVLDLVANHSLTRLRSVLKPDGMLVLSGGGVYEGGSFAGPMGLVIKAALIGRFLRHTVRTLNPAPGRHTLVELRELIESGKVTPVIDRTYPLAETPAAIRYLEAEHARAKVIITVT